MIYIANAFSLQMLNLKEKHAVSIVPCDGFPKDAVSVVGHPDTAAVLRVAFNRVSVKLQAGDVLYVAQLVGGRLPEGSTSLPAGFHFDFVKVTVED